MANDPIENVLLRPIPNDVTPTPETTTSNTSRKVDPSPRVYRQIEEAADYYDPFKYADLLSYYTDLSLQPDPAISYIGLTSASKNPKMFVVGVLPPVSNVTGAILDRSASAAALEDVLPVRMKDQGGPKLELIHGKLVPVRDYPEDEDQGSVKGESVNGWGYGAKDLPDSFWIDWVTMAERLKVDPVELAAVLARALALPARS